MITYIDTPTTLRADQLHGFFVGWPNPPSPEKHLELLRRSAHSIVAVDTDTDRVVGFINAVGDGVLTAYIPLLEVVPDYQGRGIGAELVRRMLDILRDYYMVDLCCNDDLREFYERFGMKAVVGMIHRNYSRQSGR